MMSDFKKLKKGSKEIFEQLVAVTADLCSIDDSSNILIRLYISN
jgi:hypothetical protein